MSIPSLQRILLVEDDFDVLTIARLALEAFGGFTVEVCSRGREALEKAPLFNPDLILLDVMMPDMTGLNTLLALRNLPETADVPIVFVTAPVQQHEIDHYKNSGALSVIQKPFDPIMLPATLNFIWARYHA